MLHDEREGKIQLCKPIFQFDYTMVTFMKCFLLGSYFNTALTVYG